MRRAMWGDVGAAILEKRTRADERLGITTNELTGDGRAMLARDTAARETIRFLKFMAPELADDPYLFLLEDNLMDRDARETFREKVPDLGLGAMAASGLGGARHAVRPRRHDETTMDEYFELYSSRGREGAGMIEEVVGGPGSGKSNYLAFKALEALRRGYEVFADFAVVTDSQGFHEVHSQSELILGAIAAARKDGPLPALAIIDEQGYSLGGSSRTTSTLEGRWAAAFMSRARKYRLNVTRARQADNVPAEQRGWVTSYIHKEAGAEEIARVEWWGGPRAGQLPLVIIIPSVRDLYDTMAPATFVWDVDMEEGDAYCAPFEARENPLDTWERFVRSWADGSYSARGSPGAEGPKVGTTAPPGLSLLEAASRAGVAPVTVRRWVQEGKLAAVRRPIGGRNFEHRISEEDLKAFLEERDEASDGGDGDEPALGAPPGD